MRLRTTVFGLLVVLSIVLSGTVYAGFALHKSDIVDQERRALQETAETVALDVSSRLEEKLTLVELEASHEDVAAHGSTGQRRALEQLVDRTEFGGASVVAANGTMTAIRAANLSEDRRRELVGSDFGHRTYVRRALNDTATVSSPLRGETGNTIVALSAPIHEGGDVTGSLNAALHLRRTTFFAPSRSILGPQQRLHIDFDGEVPGVGSEPDPDAVTRTATVPGTSWEVSVSQAESIVANRLWIATLFQAGAVGLVILSIGLVGVWVSRTTIDHLDDLIAGMTDLESGDYGTTIDLGATEEWARISSQFNALAETLRQRESQLRVLNRVLRHNLRNDMSVIIAHSDTVLHGDAADGDREKVRKIRQTAHNLMHTSEHARSIYEELLSGEDRERRPIDLTQVVRDRTGRLRVEFPGSTIETRLPDGAWTVGADSLPIIVEELCRNGLLHNDLPEERRELTVTVESRPDAGETHLLVRDNGPGLPAVEAELLTGDREETAIEHGSGLGLWVVNWLVEDLDGEVATDALGERGTVVTVRLPAPSTADLPDESTPS